MPRETYFATNIEHTASLRDLKLWHDSGRIQVTIKKEVSVTTTSRRRSRGTSQSVSTSRSKRRRTSTIEKCDSVSMRLIQSISKRSNERKRRRIKTHHKYT